MDTKSIQRLGRVALNDALLRNVGLQVGDSVEIYFDPEGKHIIIQKAGGVSGATEVPKNAKKGE